MSKQIKLVAEEVFKTNDEEERIKRLEELFYQIIKKSEFRNN